VHVAPEQTFADAGTLEGERKTVTALFADIKGSTELMRELDPEEARAIVDPVLQLMMAAVHRYEGYVAQSTGDGIFALFGAPAAYEDHPQRALYAALAMQQAIREHASRLAEQGRPAIEARVGVSSGEVVVRTIETGGHPEYTPIGMTANLAARLQTVASAGSIAVSESLRRQCEGYFTFRDLGRIEVKGISEPLVVHEVTGIGSLRTHFELAARRGLTRFVGRERELGDLERALELARSGHGQIVAAVAEAGAGKSRLVYEFKAALPGGCKVLEAYSVSTGRASAYMPVLELLHRYFSIEASDDPARRRGKIAACLAALDPALNDISPYLCALLGIQDTPDPVAQLDPHMKRRRTLEALKRVVLRESLNQPLVVIFEDLHWIDSQTQALLDLLADSIANARVLLLVDYRPEYRHQWGSRTYYMQLRLDPLGRDSAYQMLAELLGDSVELAPLRDFIIVKTQGNPFFVDEIVQALFEQGVLVRNGTAHLARSLDEIKLPPTVQGILAARIDRLPADEKALLQTLAVIGPEFPLGLVRRVTEKADDELERMLEDLRLGDFVYEQPAFPETEYTFKHALTQEVAHNSILADRRKTLHERTGQAIEGLYADHLDDHLDSLAYHYSRSANVGKAVNYLYLAARQSVMRTADLQALSYLNLGLELLRTLPDSPERARQELAFQIAKGESLYATQGWATAETGHVYSRARELCVRFGDKTQLFSVLWGSRMFYRWRLELETSKQLEEQLVLVAEELNDPARLAYAHGSLGTSLLWMGELVAAREHFEQAKCPTSSIEGSLTMGARGYEHSGQPLLFRRGSRDSRFP
jgi:class 3 adenylate cyclase